MPRKYNIIIIAILYNVTSCVFIPSYNLLFLPSPIELDHYCYAGLADSTYAGVGSNVYSEVGESYMVCVGCIGKSLSGGREGVGRDSIQWGWRLPPSPNFSINSKTLGGGGGGGENEEAL